MALRIRVDSDYSVFNYSAASLSEQWLSSVSLDVFNSPVTPNDPEQTDFVLLGSYPPREAGKLLERFHQAGIAFRTQARSLPPEPRPTIVIDISVDSTRVSEVAQIQRDLFGGGLPN